MTCKYLPVNNGLLMRSTVKTCFAANTILLKRNWNHVLERKMADRFPELSPVQREKKQTETNKYKLARSYCDNR